MHSDKTQEKRETNNFPQGNHKGENPTNSSEIESAPKVKPKNIKMISRQQQSLSCPNNFFSLNYVLQLSMSECVINREAHSLFILIPNLTITH